MKIKKVIQGEGFSQLNRVYGVGGVAPTIGTGHAMSDIKILVQPCLTPERAEKRQNGRRFKNEGEPMFTLTAQDRHGVMIKAVDLKGKEIKESNDIAHCLNANDQRKNHGTNQAYTMVGEVGGGYAR